MQFSPTSHHFISLRSKYSQTPSVCGSSLIVRDQVSHLDRTKGKIIVFYNLAFMSVDRRWEDKMFWTEQQEALHDFSLLLISNWIKIWFVTVMPKYLNCITFSKYLLAIFTSWFCSTFWGRDSNIYLHFSMSASTPISLLASIKECVCFSLWYLCYHPADSHHQHRSIRALLNK
jgi:hypothetical protein